MIYKDWTPTKVLEHVLSKINANDVIYKELFNATVANIHKAIAYSEQTTEQALESYKQEVKDAIWAMGNSTAKAAYEAIGKSEKSSEAHDERRRQDIVDLNSRITSVELNSYARISDNTSKIDAVNLRLDTIVESIKMTNMIGLVFGATMAAAAVAIIVISHWG